MAQTVESACNADPGSTSGSGRSPGEGNGYPLQYSSLENTMDGEAWPTTVHGSQLDTTESLSLSLYYYLMVKIKQVTYLKNTKLH